MAMYITKNKSSAILDKFKSQNRKKELEFLKLEINKKRSLNSMELKKYEQALKAMKENDKVGFEYL